MVALTIDQLLDLLSGPWGAFASDEERRSAWQLVRDDMLEERRDHLPNAFWQHEPGIPDRLRSLPPMPAEVGMWFDREHIQWRAVGRVVGRESGCGGCADRPPALSRAEVSGRSSVSGIRRRRRRLAISTRPARKSANVAPT